MPDKSKLADLRSWIEEINREVTREHGAVTIPNNIVLERVMDARLKEINELTPQLIHIALIKLLNEVVRRKGSNVPFDNGPDLFGEYPGIRRIISVGRGFRKTIANLTLREAEEKIATHRVKLARDAKKNRDSEDTFRRLVEDCREFIESDGDTLGIALERKHQSSTK